MLPLTLFYYHRGFNATSRVTAAQKELKRMTHGLQQAVAEEQTSSSPQLPAEVKVNSQLI